MFAARNNDASNARSHIRGGCRELFLEGFEQFPARRLVGRGRLREAQNEKKAPANATHVRLR